MGNFVESVTEICVKSYDITVLILIEGFVDSLEESELVRYCRFLANETMLASAQGGNKVLVEWRIHEFF